MSDNSSIDRREFIRKTSGSVIRIATAGFSLLGSELQAGRDVSEENHKYDFWMGRVKFIANRGDKRFWATYPGSDKNLLREFRRVCRSQVKLPPRCEDQMPVFGSKDQFNGVVDFTDIKAMRLFPFLFMTSEYDFTLTSRQKQNLKQYIEEGGFLLMDDCVISGTTDYFYQCSLHLLREIFGHEAVRQIPFSHEVFNNVYDFSESGLPYIQGQRHPAVGVFIKERLAVFLSATDLHCGWYGWTGKHTREYKEAIKMGINIITYAVLH